MKTAMIPKILLCVLLVSLANGALAQDSTVGIFITVKINKKYDACQKRLFARDKKISVCVPLNPIISGNEFVSLTEITVDIPNKLSYFNINLSPEAFTKLKKVTSTLPGND